MKDSVCMQSLRSPKSTAQSYHPGKTSDTKTEKRWIWAIWTMPARPMIRGQDSQNVTQGKSTLAKAPRSLAHQACKLLETKVKEKEDGPSAASATTVASLGMCGGTSAWMKLANPRWFNVRASISSAGQEENSGMQGS